MVEHVSKDTVYLSNSQYESVYIYKEMDKDYRRGIPNPSTLNPQLSPDTVYLKDVSIEYRYKMIHDTVKVVQRDSIPYEVTVVQTKEIVRPLTAYDKASRFCFWLVITAVVVILSRSVFKLKSHFRL